MSWCGKPGDGPGIIFMTIEDEGGISNLVIRPISCQFGGLCGTSVAIVAWVRSSVDTPGPGDSCVGGEGGGLL